MAKIDKARFWTGVLYPENMKENWELEIGDIVQHPYAYCKHTKDKDSKSEHRKDHVHLILAFPNTTTYKHAMGVFNLLSADGKKALNKCEAVIGIRNVYDYLIHDTEACRKQEKEAYDPSERITGNNFDIGAYEQLGAAEKEAIIEELNQVVREYKFTNFMDLFIYVDDHYEDRHYCEVLRVNSSWYEKLTRGNYQKWEQMQKFRQMPEPQQESVADGVAGEQECVSEDHENGVQQHENNTQQHEVYCPDCGSVDVKKNGKTVANTQRWACKDCGKVFV